MQPIRQLRVARQLRRELIAVEQLGQIFIPLQVLAPDHQHLGLTLSHELRKLKHAHPQQRIEQQRQHGDHEQRTPIAQLVANLASVNQSYVAPIHQSYITRFCLLLQESLDATHSGARPSTPPEPLTPPRPLPPAACESIEKTIPRDHVLRSDRAAPP